MVFKKKKYGREKNGSMQLTGNEATYFSLPPTSHPPSFAALDPLG